MRFPNHVSITRDMCGYWDYVPAIISFHKQLLVVAAPPFLVPVPMAPTFETWAPMAWPPGQLTAKHKFTSTVFHNNLTIALSGHDLGPMLIHVPSAPNDILWPVHMIMSERKANFDAGEVKANGDPIACCTMIDWALIPTPMSICCEFPLPLAGTGTAVLFNSLIVGMHWIDMLAGWVEIAIDVILSACDAPDIIADNVPGLYAGLIRLAGQEWADYHGDASASMELPFGPNLELEIGRDGEDHTWSGELSGQLGPDGANLHGSATLREGHPGSSEPGAVLEGQGGLGVLDGNYGGELDSTGRVAPEIDHPAVPTVDWLLGPVGPSTGSPWAGTNPIDNIPGWDDLPSL